jgi:hypothetical protein
MTHGWLDRYLAVSWNVENFSYCKRNKQIALQEGKKSRCNRDCPDFGASVRIYTGLMRTFCLSNKSGKNHYVIMQSNNYCSICSTIQTLFTWKINRLASQNINVRIWNAFSCLVVYLLNFLDNDMSHFSKSLWTGFI